MAKKNTWLSLGSFFWTPFTAHPPSNPLGFWLKLNLVPTKRPPTWEDPMADPTDPKNPTTKSDYTFGLALEVYPFRTFILEPSSPPKNNHSTMGRATHTHTSKMPPEIKVLPTLKLTFCI